MGHRELCVVHIAEEHAREGSEEGHRISHEEEPITARHQAEGPARRSGPDKLLGGAERPEVIRWQVFQCHHDGRDPSVHFQ